MPTIPCNPGFFVWQGKTSGNGGSFRPNGKGLFVAVNDHHMLIPNPYGFVSGDTLAARIVVGFNVGQKPRWKMEDIIRIVRTVRKKQDRTPDSSFVAQKGIYTSSVDGKMVIEDGAQILIINLANDSLKKFREQMVELAESLATALKQELVLLELQRNGQTLKTIGIVP